MIGAVKVEIPGLSLMDVPSSILLRVYADGGSRHNPGPAAIGVVVADEHDAVLEEAREFLGRGTNNRAEYMAVIRGLDLAGRRTAGDVQVVTDSELLVRQLTGKYRVRDPEIASLVEGVRKASRAFRSVRFLHRPRRSGHLARADDLVNEELDAHGFPKSH